MHRRISLRLLALGLAVLALVGCERAIFRFANRGVAPPEQSIRFAPELGLSMDVYRPALGARRTPGDRANGAGVPVVVFFYGGSWQRGERTQYRFVGRRLAEHGVLVFVADYRTYPSARFPDFVHDAARAVKQARDASANLGGDPQRLFLVGHSAGAHIAALLGTDARYLARLGMKPVDLAGIIGLSGPYDFAITGRLQKVFGPSTQWPQAQPVNFVDGDEPGFLLVHGLRDRVVDSSDSAELARRLRARGVEVELLLLADGAHSTPLAALYDPKRDPAVLQAMLDFIAGTRRQDDPG